MANSTFSNILGGVIAFVGIIVVFALLLGFPVMWLWNWLIPSIFGLGTINFWQALGLNILCGILFRNSPTSTTSK